MTDSYTSSVFSVLVELYLSGVFIMDAEIANV